MANKSWQTIRNELVWRGNRKLNYESVFDNYAPKRNTSQDKKDFINDQDSVSGPSSIENIMKNVLCYRAGIFGGDSVFGFNAESYLFEQLHWANLEFLKTIFQNDLALQTPRGVNILEVDIKVPEEDNTINISVFYTLDADGEYQEVGPVTVGERIATFNLSLSGVRGENI